MASIKKFVLDLLISICGFISYLHSQNKRTVLASAFDEKLAFWSKATKSQDKFQTLFHKTDKDCTYLHLKNIANHAEQKRNV